MEVLQSIQTDCELLGIDSYKLRPNHQLNLRSSAAFLWYILSTISSSYYLFYVDKSFERNISSYYTTTSIFVCFIQFTNLFWQMPNSTNLFSNLGQFVQQRKYKCHNILHSNQSLKMSEIYFLNSSKFRTKLPRSKGYLRQSYPLG